jgi:uncharacterized protein YhfF
LKQETIELAKKLWDEYHKNLGETAAEMTSTGGQADQAPKQAQGQPPAYQIWSFGADPQMADELLALVMSGKKQATAGLLWSYEAEGEDLPVPGEYHIITDGRETPRCIIRMTRIQVLPFNQVPEDFASREGEGDGSLDYWKKGHWQFFQPECSQIGRKPEDTMPVVCQDFQLVYPLPRE